MGAAAWRPPVSLATRSSSLARELGAARARPWGRGWAAARRSRNRTWALRRLPWELVGMRSGRQSGDGGEQEEAEWLCLEVQSPVQSPDIEAFTPASTQCCALQKMRLENVRGKYF